MSSRGVLLSGCYERSVLQLPTISFILSSSRSLTLFARKPPSRTLLFSPSFFDSLCSSAVIFFSYRFCFFLPPPSRWSSFLNPPCRQVGTQMGEWTWLKFNMRLVRGKDEESRVTGTKLLRLQTCWNSLADSWIDFNIDFVLEVDYWPATFAVSFSPPRDGSSSAHPGTASKKETAIFIPSSRRISKVAVLTGIRHTGSFLSRKY